LMGRGDPPRTGPQPAVAIGASGASRGGPEIPSQGGPTGSR
jgi:hypothetical protein